MAVALDDQAEQLIRVGKRFADALDAEWLVVSVETPAMLKLGEASRDRRVDILRLAESLGGQTVTLDGPSASAALAEHPVESRVLTDLPPVHVDSALLLQVFTNLLENVVKHTPSGTHATIEAVLEDPFVRVSIEDTGPGLPPRDVEQLFAQFHRGRGESSAGGAGLGLSICRAIVMAHGGQIDATQRPGGGARFSFTLPTS